MKTENQIYTYKDSIEVGRPWATVSTAMAEWRQRGYVPDSDDEGSDEEERAEDSVKRQCGKPDEEPTSDGTLDQVETTKQLADASSPLTSGPPPDQTPFTSDNSRSPTSLQHATAQDGFASQFAPELSSAEKLEAQLASGLQTCRDVLKSRSVTPVLSGVDSPLSSLPSSPEVAPPVAEAVKAHSSHSQRDLSSHGPAAEQPEVPPSTLYVALTGRSFRPRALMQLHPYTVEYAKYQNEWKARGLPPIRPVAPQIRQQDEAQGTTTFDSSQNINFSSRPSSPLTDALTADEDESHGAMQPVSPPQLQQDVAPDNDLPDLADILKGNAREPCSVVAKKRKLKADPRVSTRPRKLRRFNPLTDEAQDRAMEREQGVIFDMPLSPPWSARVFSSSLTSSEDIGIDFDRATPRPLPTPVLSSDRQITKRDIVEVLSSSTPETESGSGLSSSSDNDAGGDESQGVMQMRRKIKGVLPASWLRLDAQHRKQPAAHRQYTASPEKGEQSKGLAKHVVLSGRSVKDEDGRLWPPDLSSDGDDTDPASGDLDPSPPAMDRQHRIRSARTDDVSSLDGVTVEDEVDAMVPAKSRASRRRQWPKIERQQRLDDGWIVDDQAVPGIPRHAGQVRQQNAASRFYHKSGNKRRKSSTQHQLSVLDAPGFFVDEYVDVPRFLKVAGRARSSGRRVVPQNPKQKYFQLSTTKETEEVNEGLRGWTTTEPSRGRSSKSRAKDLAWLRQNSHASRHGPPRSGQALGVRTQAESDAQIRKLKTSTNKTLSRLRQQADPSPGADGVSPATNLDEHISRPRQLGVFFSHLNRSGSGSFLDPGFARAGQLEAPRVSLQLPRRAVRQSPAVQETGSGHLATAVPSHPPHTARYLHNTKARKRKLPPTMAGAADDAPHVGRRLRGGSDYSSPVTDYGETEADSLDRREKGIVNIASYYREWSRVMSTLPGSLILAELRALVKPHFGRFSSSAYISEGHFAQVLKDLASRREYVKTGPVSLSKLPSSITNKANELDSQFNMLGLMPKRQHPLLSQALVHKLFSSIHAVQRLLGDKTWFGELPTSAKVPSKVLDSLDFALHNWTAYHWFPNVTAADKAIACAGLSQLLVSAYQVADILTEADDPEMLQRALVLVEEFAYRAILSALGVRNSTWRADQPYEGSPRLLPQIDPRPKGTADFFCQYRDAFELLDVTYVVDTMIIVYHLTQRHKLPSARFDFYRIMNRLCWGPTPVGALAHAPLLIAFMRLICPLTRLDMFGENFVDAGYNGWQLISPAVQAFLLAGTGDRSIPGHLQEQDWMGEHAVLMIHCFAFVTIWEWEDPDLLLNCMFDVYAKNNMVDLCLVGKPRTSRRPFRPFVDWLDDQTDFEAFLSLITVVLRRRVNLARSGDVKARQSANNKLSTLIFRLLPNNTLPFQGAKDEKGKPKSIGMENYRCLWNHYDLYLTLYTNVPAGRSPRINLFEELVAYEHCTPEIRRLIIDVWADVVRCASSAADKAGDLEDLGHWACKMLTQLVEEYKATNVSLTYASPEATMINLNHRETLSGSVGELLRVWGSVLHHCSKEHVLPLLPYRALTELVAFFDFANRHLSEQQKRPGARARLATEQPPLGYLENPMFLTHPGGSRYATHVAALPFLDAVLGRNLADEHFCKSGHELARSIVSTILSCKGGCTVHDGETCDSFTEVLRAVTQSWFDITSRSIDLNRSWDEYLVAPSPLSFPMLSDTEYSRQARVLFMSYIIRDSPMHFIMDRTSFYASWVEGLVVPEHLMRFEQSLTGEIYRYDQSKVSLGEVLLKFTHHDETFNFSLDQMRRERFEIISHLLAKIYILQADPPVEDESQLSVEGMLTSAELSNLLRVMTDTMKRHWRLLSGARQNHYHHFIHKVLMELQSYDFEGFKVDKWFTDPNEPEFPKLTSGFGQYFVSPVGAPATALNRDMMRAFRVALVNAIVSGEQAKWDLWHEDMLAAFDCSKEQLTNDGQLKIDSCLQTEFLRVIFPVYMELGSQSPVAVPLLCAVVRLLVELVKRAYTRVKEAGDSEEFCEVGMAVLGHVGGYESASEWGLNCLKVSGEELELRRWAKRDLLACEGMKAGDWVWEGWEGGVEECIEEAKTVVKQWEIEREKEVERSGWEALGLTFE